MSHPDQIIHVDILVHLATQSETIWPLTRKPLEKRGFFEQGFPARSFLIDGYAGRTGRQSGTVWPPEWCAGQPRHPRFSREIAGFQVHA